MLIETDIEGNGEGQGDRGRPYAQPGQFGNCPGNVLTRVDSLIHHRLEIQSFTFFIHVVYHQLGGL